MELPAISQAEIGDRLLIRVTDGTLETEVKSKKKRREEHRKWTGQKITGRRLPLKNP